MFYMMVIVMVMIPEYDRQEAWQSIDPWWCSQSCSQCDDEHFQSRSRPRGKWSDNSLAPEQSTSTLINYNHQPVYCIGPDILQRIWSSGEGWEFHGILGQFKFSSKNPFKLCFAETMKSPPPLPDWKISIIQYIVCSRYVVSIVLLTSNSCL